MPRRATFLPERGEFACAQIGKRTGKAMLPRGCGCAGNNPEIPPKIHKKKRADLPGARRGAERLTFLKPTARWAGGCALSRKTCVSSQNNAGGKPTDRQKLRGRSGRRMGFLCFRVRRRRDGCCADTLCLPENMRTGEKNTVCALQKVPRSVLCTKKAARQKKPLQNQRRGECSCAGECLFLL